MNKVLQRYGACLFTAAVLVGQFTSPAAELTWGTNGSGGSGTWNTTATNWWNGTAHVSWTGGTAIFGGTGGVVATEFSGPTADALVFDVPGYSIQSGWLFGGPQGLTVTTNAPATISATLTPRGVNRTLVKDGAATLTVTGTNFFDKVEVKEGEYRVGGTSSLFFADVVIGDAPGALVTLASDTSSVFMGSLSGGGVVQPDARARTVTLDVFGGGSFYGTLQDNAMGVLALDVSSSGSAPVALSGVNTYSGNTSLSSGTLGLAGTGSILNSGVTIYRSAVLQLDNSGTANSNRISDSRDLMISGGQIEMIGHGVTPVNERIGDLLYSGASKINVTAANGVDATLTFSDARPLGSGTLQITGNGNVIVEGLMNQSSGLLSPHITHGNDWAKVEAGGRIVPFTAYAEDLNAASPDANVKLSGGNTSLLGSAIRNSLNFGNAITGTSILSLESGNTLTLTSGGLLSSGVGPNQIQGGTVSTSAGEFVITNFNALTISSAISASNAGTGLTKSGPGTLTLSGTNTFSGNVAITEGILEVSSDLNLGTGTEIGFRSGSSLRAVGDFSSGKKLAGAATIDTNSHSVVFSGSTSSASISKTGAGTLTLTQADIGRISISQGTLNLPTVFDGDIDLRESSLLVAGTLASFALDGNLTLDIGGPAAATLVNRSLDASSLTKLTINFGIGGNASDLWRVQSTSSISIFPNQSSVVFNFRDLGGLVTGKNYTLIELPFTAFPPLTKFTIAPELVQSGWSGTFTVTSQNVSVKFSSVPEPSVSLLVLAGTCWAGLRRPSRKRAC